MKRALALVRLMRPQQWIKNGFVLVGLLFGHGWRDPGQLGAAAALFAAFCLASSATYALNDVMDRTADRRHPVKRARPVASGAITPGHGLALAFALAGLSLAVSAGVSLEALGFTSVYLVLNVGYSAGLKEVAILDVFIIAAGFMLRILAGTVGLGIAPSHWLLLCGLMLTIFLGFAKRRAELGAVGEPGTPEESERREQMLAARGSLAGYSPLPLDGMILVSAAATLVTYGLYSVDEVTILTHGTDRLVWTVPFVVFGLFRYLHLLYRGGGADPALEVLNDRQLLVALIGWLVAVTALIA